jgi:putative spermidine/putrescine transport system substrate-binding protein
VVEADPSTAALLSRSGGVESFVPSLAGEVPGLVAGSPVWAWSSMVVFAVDRSRVAIVPTSFRELSNASYAGNAHLVGDPRTDVMARAVVMAASVAAGGSPDDTARGAKYFLSATQAGVFTADSDAPIAVGTTASVAATVQQWQEAGREVKFVFPADGLLGVPFSPLQVRGTSHVPCAQLWIEHLLSDDGALSVLLGHGVPARLAGLQQRALLTSDMAVMVPSASQWSHTVQVTDGQLKTALAPIEASPVWK